MARQNNGPQNSNTLGQISQDNIELLKQYEELNKRVNNTFSNYVDAKKQFNEDEKRHFDIEADINRLRSGTQTASVKAQIAQYDLERKILEQKKLQLKNMSLMKMGYKELERASMRLFTGSIVGIVNYLMEADKAFKSVNLEIGLSGNRSKILLNNLINSASQASMLGVSFEELTKIQSEYTSEMGRAVLLSKDNFRNITLVAKGTKMGTDEAGRMAAKFNLMGKSVESFKTFYEDAVTESEKYGVSANTVISKINENLDKSQGYVFKGGVKGLADMAKFATKFKVDMTSVFSAMDKANGLEGAVEMASQLQVIGGKFANQNPFTLLNQARNDAEGFTKSMQGMTKGMATFNKRSGEFEIQAGDLNRLKLAAEATGMSYEELIKQAKQGAQIDKIGAQLSGSNLSKEAKEFVNGIAQVQKDGSFKVQIAPNEFRDIRSLSEGQIKALKNSNQTLEERAKSAQSFDEMLKNTINELKTTFLPLLKGINSITQWLSKNESLVKAITYFGATSLGLIAIVGTLKPWIGIAKTLMGSSLFGSGSKVVSGAVGTTGTIPNTGTGGQGNLAGQMTQTGQAAGANYKNILAYGAAVLMVGGAIWLATKGIATMAEAFKGLNSEQLVGINLALVTLGLTFGGLALVMTTIGTTAILPMLAFGGAILAVGAGIAIASAGIGYMAKGFGDMFDSIGKVTDPKVVAGLSGLVLSMGALGIASLLFANPLSWIGLKVLSGTVGDISDKIRNANFDSLAVASTNFNKIAEAIDKINDKKLDKLIAVSQSLSGMGGLATAIASLKNVFGDAIEVKFKDQKVDLEVNITNEINGNQLGSVMSKLIPVTIERSKQGSAT